MGGSSFGTNFKITTFGESHGAGIGVVIDGCPAGIPLSVNAIQLYLDRRKPGNNPFSTPRKESDTVEILSGVFDGKTTGTPIALLIRNENQHSSDYENLKDCYRPGHADYTFDAKFGLRDYRGGGRSSGRETAARVAAGAVACALLSHFHISVCAYARSIFRFQIPCEADYLAETLSTDEICSLRDESPLALPDPAVSQQASEFLSSLREEANSCGGLIECVIHGLPAGLGDPVFDKFDARLAAAMLSVGAVKGFEIGSGFSAASLTGLQQNDVFCSSQKHRVTKLTNRAGGVLGGITDGSDVLFRVAVKPTPSISGRQQTIRSDGTSCTIEIKGRHDPVIVPRAVVVIESMAAIVAADALISNLGSRLNNLEAVFSEPEL